MRMKKDIQQNEKKKSCHHAKKLNIKKLINLKTKKRS